MNHVSKGPLADINRSAVTPFVRQLLCSESAEILDWEYQALYGGGGDLGAGLVGIYHFSGHASDHGQVVPWSLVLKSTQTTGSEDIIDYFTREWFAYHSGFLGQLSGHIVAPRCFGTSKQPDNLLWIWLENLVDADEQPWSLESYAQVARHFGQWNGGYLTGDPLPDYAWFCPSTSREWALQAAPEIEFLRTSLEHPVIQQMYPAGQAQTILDLWDKRETFFRTLEQLPQTVCHNDAFRRNLFRRHTGDGRDQTIAIDWANLGWGAVGEEVATMVMGNLAFNEVDWTLVAEFTTLMFESYLDGLRDAGWNGDPRMVRLGFTAAAAMKYSLPYGLQYLCTEEGQAWLGQLLHQNREEALSGLVEKRAFTLDLADEARSLMEELDLR